MEGLLKTSKSQGSNSKLEEMLRKQASNFRAFNRTVANIDLNSATEKWELEDILKTLQTRWSVIDNLHWQLDVELEGNTDKDYETAFSGHERTFNRMKREINSNIFNAGHQEYSTPKLEIPEFSGDYLQWVSFKDLFTEAIHSNRSLSSAQKMQFLKGKVKGEAERLIQHLPISSDNYSICWEILNHRYNNQKLMFTAHINTIMNLPISQQQSMTHIKRLHDTTVESMNAIKNLGVDVRTWDPIIVHIISQKVDSETHNKYVQSLTNPRDLPKLTELLAFLETIFTSMEVSRKKQDFSQAKSGQNNQQNQFETKYQNPKFIKQAYYATHQVPKTSSISHSVSKKHFSSHKIKCPICYNDHGLYYCESLLRKSPPVKLRIVQSLDLCQNCLFDHKGKPCISKKTCRECNSDHNTILHEAFVPESANKTNQMFHKKSGAEQQQVSINNLHVSQKNYSNEILLATAIIEVQAADGTYKQMRALIDQGSQACLISEDAAQRLSLPRHGCIGSIFGVGAKESTCKGVINITCTSKDDSYTFQTPAFIMNQVIKQLPNQSFQMPSWTFLENRKLADPEFNISKPVDILLGADIYSKIMLSGIYKVDEFSPIAQQTRLGWILCGSMKKDQCNNKQQTGAPQSCLALSAPGARQIETGEPYQPSISSSNTITLVRENQASRN